MIPSTNTKLLVAEDWKKVYQSFRGADFKSYDFETLRRTMISYLQENYPEDFNDFIDSSEYVALIDLIAYLGQNLSFRIDLNARENFLETAQRRDSILRLAQLISYTPTRNIPASGFLKITAVSTSDNVIDSNGTNLANTTIGWNDATNPDWYQQFINIMNAAMVSNFGKPANRNTIDGILTEQYAINSANADVPLFSFNKNINGTPMSFEVVSSSFAGKNFIYEVAPKPAGKFNFVYKNDNQGSGSANTGFFAHFKQGSLSLASFSLSSPVPNEIIGVNTPDINNNDVWLWQLDKNGDFATEWTAIPSTAGNSNVIYNSINKNIRTVYAITSRDTDQIDLNFSDGVFGDLPNGEFRLFYRQSNGKEYIIKPDQMSGIIISIPYTNTLGQQQSLTITLSLQYSVTNSAGAESNASIQRKAPQSYYLQNRMITGEDYNIAPLSAGSDILKIKSINRVASGISKYFDISDVSGRYSKTNIFANDGVLYKEETERVFEFSATNRNQILAVLKNDIAPIIVSPEVQAFYFEQYPKKDVSPLALTWNEINKLPNESRGYFNNTSGVYAIGIYSKNNLQYATPGALIKFLPPTGKYFDQKNNLKRISCNGVPTGGRLYIWATIKQIIGDGSANGTGKLADGTGPVIFNTRVPDGAIPTTIIPHYAGSLSYAIENEIANICLTQRNFGITINSVTRNWDIILNSNLNTITPFSLTNQDSIEDANLDASWIMAFIWTGKQYKVQYRVLNYIFASEHETSFFVDESSVNFDFITNSVIKDKVDVLSINPNPSLTASLGVDYSWQINKSIVESNGSVDPKKVLVSFYDSASSGQIVDPDSFNNIVDSGFIYFKKSADGSSYELTSDDITSYTTEDEFNQLDTSIIDNGTLYYFSDPTLDVVKYWSTVTATLVYTDTYIGRQGRSDLKFHYVHNSGEERRIDPSKTNIIDIYLLTTSYDNDMRSWIAGNIPTKPLSPTSQSLSENYSAPLENIKAISDEIVFHPATYKILFGTKADTNLQAKFKAVKNSNRPTSDSDLKTRILSAIGKFFELENWEFGQSFHFSELSTYVMNQMSPDITNFVIVPTNDTGFGSLYEISCLSNEIFISGTTIADIEIIDAITASQLNTQALIVTTSGT